ncbi:DUF3142 domain-containing protein [bacterium]|nr:MAG: DUF3142 domain-containing protein [bacterium]
MVSFRRLYCLLLFTALLAAGCRRAPLPPAEIGMWYWHTPFRVTDQEWQDLKAIGVKTLYVRAGTLVTDGKEIKLILPQRWESKAKDVVLTFNFHPGLVSHMEELSTETIAAGTLACIRDARTKAANAGIQASGIQLDIDCPTRLLPRYREILDRVRTGLPAGETFSITALPTWLASKHFPALAEAVDFVVPQFYEGRTGKTIHEIAPITDPEGLRKGLAALARLDVPCYIGLATYGHALQYDGEGRLVSVYGGLSAEDALRHPALEPLSSSPVDGKGHPTADPAKAIGEDLLLLRAISGDDRGRGRGYGLAYLLPTPLMVERQMAAFRAERPSGAKGVIFYRFPEPGESMTLPLASVAKAMTSTPTEVDVAVAFKVRSEPWSLIGTDVKSDVPPRQFTVTVVANGDAPSKASREAFELFVLLDKPGLDGVAPGDFDEAVTGSMADGAFVPAAPAHAQAIRFRRYHLLPGDRLRSGLLLVPADGARTVRAHWTAQGTGGFRVFQGDIPSQPLLQPEP